jgi:hypothetical protein
VLYHAPKPYSGYGRPHKHGEKFSLKEASTWTVPQEDLTVEDSKLGRLRVYRWESLHLKQAADHPFTLILVERLDAPFPNPCG